jgi:integrase
VSAVAHIQKRGDRWQARYRAPDGRERTKRFDRKVDAQRWLATVEADKARGTYVDPEAGQRTFGDYAASWRAGQVHRPTTAAQVETHLRRHVLPTFGRRRLSSVRPSDVQAWVEDRATVLEPATVEVVYRYLSAIFTAAVEDGLLAKSPCRGIRLPKVEKPRVTPPTVQQVQAITEAMPERYRALVTLAATTGLRQGECFGLTVDHVDLDAQVLRVEQQLVSVNGRAAALAPPKTAASRRAVPLPNVTVDALSEHLERFYMADSEPIPGLIFTDELGRPLRRNRFGEMWRPVAGGLHFHDLRHFYASLLIRHGESVKVVQARLGHASAAETLDTYSHLWPDSEDRTRAAVDGVLSPAASPVASPSDPTHK